MIHYHNTNTRRFPRTLQEAFGENTSLEVLPMPEPQRRPIDWRRLARSIGELGRRAVVRVAGH